MQRCNQDNLVRGGMYGIVRLLDYLIEDLHFFAGASKLNLLCLDSC